MAFEWMQTIPEFDAKRTACQDVPEGERWDPDQESNGDRAERVAKLLPYLDGADYDEGEVSDFLSNFMHFAHSRGMDVHSVLWTALHNFEAEAGAL